MPILFPIGYRYSIEDSSMRSLQSEAEEIWAASGMVRSSLKCTTPSLPPSLPPLLTNTLTSLRDWETVV